MKILILLSYYDRPNMVRIALESIRRQSHDDFEVAFIDDGSTIPGRPIAEDILADHIDKVRFYSSGDTIEQKIAAGGSRAGYFLQLATEESDADIVLVLCDDDALYEDSLRQIAEFYEENPEVMYSYGHVAIFNPEGPVVFGEIPYHLDSFLNQSAWPINPYCQVDASQVTWRRAEALEAGVKWPYPQTAALDAEMFSQLLSAYGLCQFNDIIVQYKGVYPDQMGNRQGENFLRPRDKDRNANAF